MEIIGCPGGGGHDGDGFITMMLLLVVIQTYHLDFCKIPSILPQTTLPEVKGSRFIRLIFLFVRIQKDVFCRVCPIA